MTIRKLICFFFFLFFSITTWADKLIIEPDMGRAPIIDAIKHAQHSIDLVMYGFTDEQILSALLAQQGHGKTLRVILERSPYKRDDENNKIIQAFDTHHVHWQGDIPPFQLIHQKTLLIDDKTALVMTFNFTKSTFKNERNFALIIDDAKRVNEIAAIFAADWNHKAIANHDKNLILSPDDSRQKLLSLINQSKSSLKIYAQSVNDYNIVGALASAAKRGVRVDILTSAKLKDKQENYLRRAGVNLYYSKKRYIHAKVMMIDNKFAVIGSINLTRPSLDNNRELSVVTDDAAIIQQLNATFATDCQNIGKVSKRRTTKLDQRLVKRTIKHSLRLLNI